MPSFEMFQKCTMIIVLIVLGLTLVEGAKFAINGPMLTVTLKDPNQSGADDSAPNKPWLDLASLHPNIVWSIQSQQPPLPEWLPSLRSVKAGVGYQYNDMKHLPSWVEGTAKFSINAADAELSVQPSYEVRSRRLNLMLQLTRGASYVFARLGGRKKHLMEAVRSSVLFNLPFATISSVRVTPSVDFVADDVACTIEAMTGGTGRTKAVLNLEYQNPTLAVIHALDQRNTIAPEISLYNAKITYQWNLALPSGSSLRTTVDPTSAIDITWTDQSADGGLWVTDLRLPLEGTTVQALAADVRVRRQFRF